MSTDKPTPHAPLIIASFVPAFFAVLLLRAVVCGDVSAMLAIGGVTFDPAALFAAWCAHTVMFTERRSGAAPSEALGALLALAIETAMLHGALLFAIWWFA